jgi:hypothetical protein
VRCVALRNDNGIHPSLSDLSGFLPRSRFITVIVLRDRTKNVSPPITAAKIASVSLVGSGTAKAKTVPRLCAPPLVVVPNSVEPETVNSP